MHFHGQEGVKYAVYKYLVDAFSSIPTIKPHLFILAVTLRAPKSNQNIKLLMFSADYLRPNFFI